MTTSIVILTHNRLPVTKLCLEALRTHTPERYELIIVDNGSMDGTGEYLRHLEDEGTARVIYNTANEGYPRGCNQGLALASGNNLLLLNNDIVVSPGWLGNLLRCLEANPSHGLVGPMSNRLSGGQQWPLQFASLGEAQRFARAFNRSDPRRWRRAVRLSGGCLLMRREVYERVGPLDERFSPGNFEDDDYCLRAWAEGFTVVIAGDTFVYHFDSEHFRADAPGFAELMARNERVFREKWGTDDAYCGYFRADLANAVPMRAGRVLDLRCRAGALGVELKNRGAGKVVGVEPNPQLVRVATRTLDAVYHGGFEDPGLPFGRGEFDAVVMADVLEHARDPWSLLGRVAGWLKSGGVAVALVPNVGHLSVLAELLAGGWRYGDSGVLQRGHLRFFTPASIAQSLADAGLEVLGVEGVRAPASEAGARFLGELAALAGRYGIGGRDLPARSEQIEVLVRARKR